MPLETENTLSQNTLAYRGGRDLNGNVANVALVLFLMALL